MCVMADNTYRNADVPPGKKLIKYHTKHNNCTADDPNTIKYPDTP
jgi:hypothetical protein